MHGAHCLWIFDGIRGRVRPFGGGCGSFLVCSSCLLLRFYPTIAIPTAVITVITNLHMVSAVFFSGGPDSAVLLAVPLSTVFLGLLGGRGHSVATGIFMSLGMCLIFLVEDSNIVFGQGLPTDDVFLGVLVWSILTGTLMAVYSNSDGPATETGIGRGDASSGRSRRSRTGQSSERALHGLFVP